MAGNSQRNSSELKQEIARSRIQVRRDLRGLRNELDIPRKIRRSIQREPVPWIVAAGIVGLTVVILLTRKRKVYVEGKKTIEQPKSKLLQAGFVLGTLKIAANLLKPVVLPFLTQKLSEISGRRTGSAKSRV